MKTLTPKQRKFVKELATGKDPGNKTQAAFDSYNVKGRKQAKGVGYTTFLKPHVKKAYEELMDKHEITDDVLVEKVKEGLDANVVANYKGKITKTNSPDYAIRHKYLDTSLRLKDAYPADKVDNRNINVDLEVEAMSKEELTELLKQQLQQVSEK